MEITIQSLHFTAKEKLTSFVNDKIGKLEHIYDRIESAQVCLKLDKSDSNENKVCEIRLVVPGNDLFAKRNAKTFEEATNEAAEALQKQIKKLKTKFNNR